MEPGVRRAVEGARNILRKHGFQCQTTADDLEAWFRADTPFDQGSGLDVIITNPLLVVHELVEIEEVKRMGLALTKDVIVKNLEKVDDAHLRAAEVELQIAASMRDVKHLARRAENVKMWSEDATVTHENKMRYRDMYDKAMDTIEAIRATMRRRNVVAVVIASVVTVDVAVLKWAVPWADEHYVTHYGSLGYVLTFLIAFVTLVILIGLVAYYFQRESYASERWR